MKQSDRVIFRREFGFSNANMPQNDWRIENNKFEIFEISKNSGHEMWKVGRTAPEKSQPISGLALRNWSSIHIIRVLFAPWLYLNICSSNLSIPFRNATIPMQIH